MPDQEPDHRQPRSYGVPQATPPRRGQANEEQPDDVVMSGRERMPADEGAVDRAADVATERSVGRGGGDAGQSSVGAQSGGQQAPQGRSGRPDPGRDDTT